MDAEHTVRTRAGRVRGTVSQRSENGGVTVHRGIPYAAAPFGDLRFSAPAPAPAWDGVRDCTAFGPPPPQGAQLLGAAPWNARMSPDCLSLTVWSAAREGDRAPVLVWIHGGAYIVGASSEAAYDGTGLAESGLVVVGVNYRVGFEGFGHVPGRPDNRGLLDQAAALRWVRDNVAAFGGDPDNVTVAGESAGAGSVVCLMASPVADGLFRRAIAHSVPGDMITPDTARSVSARVAGAAGVPLDADALAALAPEAVLEAVDAVLSAPSGSSGGVRAKAFTCFAPVVGGPELPLPPLEAVAGGAAAGVDLLTGHNAHEYRLFTELGQSVEIDDESALELTAARLGLGEGAVAAYRAADPGASPRLLYAAIQGDAVFGEYTVRLAEAHASGGGRAHLFRLAFESPALGGRLGACHALDLPFAFGNLDTDLALFLLDGKPTEAHTALSGRMVAAWRDFAATGDPGWPAVTAGATAVKVWDVEDSLGSADAEPLRALWSEVPLTPR
ncbi:carboxylesterase/lipase family protein [Nocardiopsis tropica]|uniref:Carboxylic ester hydrolase n=1 Tax=Nocardiopsis tropica TaxID=109330 RepID=A0ABU7KP23_9ACTN|nr:carboxylesterase family protein [Nocardiopsis umidischolae]MEE2051035.1 carboxylesterase family protein [Nocardiopsis umidischolae]